MKKIYFISAILIAALGSSCTKEARLDYVDENAPAPAQISHVKIGEQAGGAIITYKIPNDPNFSYAKAIYEIQPGVYREVRASLYSDTLKLIGYGDTLKHEVKIFSVGRNKKESDPISVSVSPLTPPIKTTFGTLTLDATFGGVEVSFRNDTKANLAIELMEDTTGRNTWSTITTFYTGAATGVFSARGLNSAEKKFGVFVRDRWNNKSDTLLKSLTPLFEETILKDKWKAVHLPTDTWQSAPGLVLERVWDNSLLVYDGTFGSPNNSVLPHWFTIDLGQKVVMSRIREHQASGSHCYNGSGTKKFEIWGSNNPDPDGGWKNWQLMGTFDSFKPSGLPVGKITAEDTNYAWFLGEEFTFQNLTTPVRYLRYKTLETWASTGQVVIAELDIYGKVQP